MAFLFPIGIRSGRWPAGAGLVALVLVLAGCAYQEVLVPKSDVPPDGIDFSGRWRLQPDDSNEALAAAERAAAAEEGIRLPPPTREQTAKPTAKRASLVHVFLETGSMLKITQTAHGLFVSFDRAIVEEYRFGENRIVSVGPVEAERVSGWDEGAYVIETLDEEGNKLVERYQLEDDARVLLRQVSIYERGRLNVTVVQKYDRV